MTKEQTVGGARVVQRQDVGVLQSGRDVDLSQKSLAAQGRSQLRPEHLDGCVPILLTVMGPVDGCHPATADLAVHRVAGS